MAIVNINKFKLLELIKKSFPTLRKPENLVDVILAGWEMQAIDLASAKSKWWFVNKGAKPHVVHDSYTKHKLLKKKKAPRVIILFYKRGKAPHGDYEIRVTLNSERRGLYMHLTVSSTAREAVANVLKLTNSSVAAIKKAMETGTIREQVDLYDKVVTELNRKKLYNNNYNYVWLGFRFLPDKYWLSNLAQKLVAQSKT